MLKKRLIAVLTFKDGVLFRTKQFQPDYRYTLNYVDTRSIDEIVMLDVTRPDQRNRKTFLEVITAFATNCFVPITVGGGIRSLDGVETFFKSGADKIAINTGALLRPEFISDIAKKYGQQSVVISIDVRQDPKYGAIVMSDNGAVDTGRTVKQWAKEAEDRGAGEILLNSIEGDGSLEGLNIELLNSVCSSVTIPVLGLGGVGNWPHIAEAFNQTEVAGVCTQNIYHFTEKSIESAKHFLRTTGIAVR